MSTQLKLRRGTTAQHSTFTGAEGEITVDTTKDTIVVHDGATAGGIPLAKESALSGYVSTGGGVISANTSTDALRITQTGAGNALVVEDSANPDSTPFVIDTSGKALLGQTFSWAAESLLNTSGGFNNGTFLNNQYAYNYVFTKSRSTTPSVKTIVQNADALGSISWRGDDGVGYIDAATITASVDGTPGTNDMPGRLVFSTTADGASSPTERMRIDSAGNVGIGGTTTNANVYNAKQISGAVNAYGFRLVAEGASSVTNVLYGYGSALSTNASAYTLTSSIHFAALGTTIGSGSTVTNQYGFWADAGLTGATNNYGFYSNIASGTGRYNFYAAGSADNYMAGSLGIARTNPSVELEVGDGNGTRRISIDGGSSGAGGGAALYFKNGGTVYGGLGNPSALDGSAYSNLITLTSYYGLTFNTLATERMRIDSSGNVIQTAPTTAPTLSTNGTMVFNLTSNTNLRVSVRGSDGVTRTANITLA